jgi:hypothetical protein
MKAANWAWHKRLIAQLRLYPLAAQVYEGWPRMVRPHTHGALVAIWQGQELLLVETSYRRSWSLPGPPVSGKMSPLSSVHPGA